MMFLKDHTPCGLIFKQALTGLSLLLLVAMLQGCRKSEPLEPGKFVADVSRTMDSLAMDDVLVAVNDATFTRGDFELLLAGLERNLQIQRPNINPQMRASLRKRWEYSVIGEFVAKELLVQEAHRRGLQIAPDILENTKKTMLEPLARSRKIEVDALANALEPDIKALYAMAQDNALIQTLRRQEFGERLTVTEAEFQDVRDRIRAYNEICAQTNALIMARAQEIVTQAQAGADFRQLASATTQDEEHPDGSWGTFVRVEIDDDQVAEAAFSLPVGGVSEPLLTDEGLVIIKVIAREGVDVPMATDSASVQLDRIVLWWAEEQADESDDELWRRLTRERLQELQGALVRDLREKARLEYPNGTNFFAKARKPSPRRMRGDREE